MKNNLTIALNVLYAKKVKICLVYVSKHNSNCENQVIFFMVSNGKGWHCLAVKKLSALLRGITSKHHGDFYCQNYLHIFATENKHQSQQKVCDIKDFFNVVMPAEDNKF